ncbi:Asp23/Gls24 family envelope stress response protein [Streptomyces sp. DSM 42041]|uniref:Asp23/Gls24 family envelope stress response protein n=1 Tax=Streptomyces hazeniae TaxID=3075538 RepID=A0ABU2NZR3_9ACTN|nr:Asp23/Gls24 family envelope stress response protein [Streptomyces sp. DSM 42041]MDT0382468.1 Asp23/Gls24 family envelope stress response protein [Streptomyces sp. DSM 42041]
MSDQDVTDRVTRAAARAAEEAPGVAFLRPGLAELVRGTALPHLKGTTAPADPPRTGGVRARRQGTQGTPRAGWRLELHLAVLDGHRALDVTRAVRAAVTDAVRGELAADTDVTVAVTVTDIA